MFNVADLAGEKQRAFEDTERHSTELKLILLHTLFEWMAAIISHPSLSLLDFIDGCS